MAKSSKSDFDLIVGANRTLSYSQMTQDINAVIERINKYPKKIKLTVDIKDAEVRRAVAKINDILKKIGSDIGGSAGRGGGGGSSASKDKDETLAYMRALIQGYNQLTQMKRKAGTFTDTDNAALERNIEELDEWNAKLVAGTADLDAYNKKLLEVKASVAGLMSKTAGTQTAPGFADAKIAAQKKGAGLLSQMMGYADKLTGDNSQALANMIRQLKEFNSEFDPKSTSDIAEYDQRISKLSLSFSQLMNDVRATDDELKRNQALTAGYKQLRSMEKNVGKWDTSSDNELMGYIDKLKALNDQYERGEKSLAEYRAGLAQISRDYANLSANAMDATKPVSTLNDLLKWTTIVKTFKSAYKVIKQMAQVSIELDQAFTQLQIVTGATDRQMRQFTDTAVNLAKELGQSVSGIASSIETFSRLGYTLDEAASLSKYAQILANVAGVDIGEATTGLTSIIKGFGLDVDQAEHVADILVEVGRKYAVSASEMMEAYEKSGSALHATNTSLEKSAGLIAAANASVQNASTVGTALKTVSARIRGSKTDLSELGEDTEEFAQGFSKYAKEIQALTKFNIMVEGSTSEFKDLYDIMDGIAAVWDKLTDTQQARVSEILGGTRQLQVISSIIGNWKDAAGAYSDAASSIGVAAEANDRYMESAQAHLNQLKATYQELAMTVADSDMLKQAIDFGTSLLEIANTVAKVIDSIGGLKVVLTAVVGLILTIKLEDIVSRGQKLLDVITNMSRAAQGLGSTMQLAQLNTFSFTASVTALIAVISWLKKIEQERVQALQETSEEYSDNAKTIDSYKQRVSELQKSLQDSNTSQEESVRIRKELSDIQNEVIDKYGAEAKAINLVGDSAEVSANKLNRLLASEANRNLTAYSKEFAGARAVMETPMERYKFEIDQNAYTDEVGSYFKSMVSTFLRMYGGNKLGVTKDGNKLIYTIIGTPKEAKEALTNLSAQLGDFTRMLRKEGVDDALVTGFAESITTAFNKLDSAVGDSEETYNWYIDSLIAAHKRYRDAYTKVQEVANSRENLLTATFGSEEEREQAIAEYEADLKEALTLVNKIDYGDGELGVKDRFLSMLNELPKTVGSVLEKAVEQIEDKAGKLDFEALGKFKNAVSSLSSAWNDMFDKDGEKKLYSALESIHENFSDVEGIDLYIKRLTDAKGNSKEFASVLNDLITTKVLDETESELLAGTEEDLIAAMLREAGVANDSEAALDILTIAKGRMRLKTIDSTEALDDFITGLEDEAAYSEVARKALVKLAAQQIATNNVNMSMEQQIAALQRLAKQAGVSIGAIEMLASVAAAVSDTSMIQKDVSGKITRDSYLEYVNNINRATKVLDLRGNEDVGQTLIDKYLKLIDDATGSISLDYIPPKRQGKDEDGSDKDEIEEKTKAIEEYIAEIDKYREAIKRLNDVQQVRGKVDETIAHSDDLKAQILMQKELISLYSQEQQALHALNDLRDKDIEEGAQKLRELGFAVQYNADTNELWIENLEHLNELIAEDKGSYETIEEATNAYRKETEELVNSITDLNEKNQESSQSWWDLKYSIEDADEQIQQLLKDIVKQASEGVDAIQSVYETLHSAADEYAQTGYISVDTLQSVIGLGVEYMAYLRDENGQLVINEERIRDVIAAKTEQLAIESSLSYIEALRLAQERGNTEELNRLLYATESATDATWGLVYASLGLLDLDSDQYQAALDNINAIRAMAESAIVGLDDMSHSVVDELNRMKSGVDDILKYVMDMLKQKIQDQVDALNDMKTAYSDIIQKQKESLKTAKSEADARKEMANKLKEIAKIQAQVDALSLDTSRESQAKRASLLEELSSLQEDLADKQTDYMIEKNDEALDKMDKAYSEQKDREIETLQDSISSYQRLYSAAIEYIQEHWETLYDELIDYNESYGSVLNSEIKTAWDNALDAAQRYGDYVSAMNALPGDIEAAQSSGGSYGLGNTNYDSSSSDEEQIRAIVNQMKRNSEMWHKASDSERKRLSDRNKEYANELAEKFGLSIYRGSDGVWYMMDGRRLYDVYHSGGIVGGLATPKQNETMALLENGEAVYTKTQQRGLERIISLMSKLTGGLGSGGFLGGDSVIGSMLSKIATGDIGGNGAGVQIGQLNVTAPIQVIKELNDDEIRRHSKMIGAISAEYIKEGFTKHGVKAPVAII